MITSAVVKTAFHHHAYACSEVSFAEVIRSDDGSKKTAVAGASHNGSTKFNVIAASLA